MFDKKWALYSRILSFILVLISVISLLPLQVFSTDLDLPEENGIVSDEQTEAADNDPIITLDGEPVSSLSLLPHEKQVVRIEGVPETASCQWQILHPKAEGMWINIYDAMKPALPVTLALVGRMLNEDNAAQLRCRVTDGDMQQYSPVLTVVVEKEKPVETLQAVSTSPSLLAAAGEGVPEFVTVTINYYRYDYVLASDGKTLVLTDEPVVAFTPYVASLKSGSDLRTSVACPTIMGYDAYLVTVENGVETETLCEEVAIDLSSIQKNVTYRVNYKPAEVNYEVRYFFQNIYDDLYVEDAALVKTTLDSDTYPIRETGETGTNPDPDYTQTVFPGFTSLYYEPEKIAADGSTVFHVYYERDYYLMEFDCNGGYGTDTLYVRYGTYISVPNPVRSGWVFSGWDLVRTAQNGSDVNKEDGKPDVLPSNMPSYHTAYKALWTESNTTYSVAYWIVNDDGTRSYLGGRTVGGITGDDAVASHDLKSEANNGPAICDLENHTHTDACYICGVDAHTHTNNCFNGMNLSAVPGADTNRDLAISDLEGGGSPESGYIYVIYNNDSKTYWPKLYLEDKNKTGTYYVVNNTQGGSSVDSFSNIIDGEAILTKTGTYGTETLTTTKYKPRTTCATEQHIHNNACRPCRAHTHSDACYQDDRHLTPVETITITTENGDEVTYTSDTKKVIEGDGSTVLNVYYQYKEYTLKFYYAASTTSGTGNNATTTYKIIGGTSYYFGGQHSVGNYNNYLNSTTMDMLNRAFGGGSDRVGNTEAGSVPSLNTEGQRRVDERIYTQGSEYDTGSKRTYYYISFKARYGDDISEKWPIDVFNPVTMANGYTTTHGATGAWKTNRQATVSAWNGEHHVWYSKHIANETIKGKYQKLDYKILYDESFADSTTVSYLCFWENGAVTNWNVPRLFRYNIWVEALNSEIRKDADGNPVYDKNGNPIHVDGVTPMKTLNGVIYERIDVYNTCDNSTAGEQTQPALIGFTIKDPRGNDDLTAAPVVNGDSVVTNPEKQFDSDVYASGMNVHFYYTRNSNDLKFWNYNGWLGEGKGAGNDEEGSGVKYGTPLNIFGNYVSAQGFMDDHYPDGLEPGAYSFEGWYTSSGCYEGTEVNWDDTMPDSALTLYAKWTPVVHDVYFYENYDNYTSAIDPNETNKDQYYWYHEEGNKKVPESYPIKVEHGNLLGTAYNNTPQGKPDYTFVGWFYIDEAGKKRFAPDTMEVKQDLHLFAEWRSSIDTQYTVNYVLHSDGTPIAEPTTGHLTAGKTKTFTAKAEAELFLTYQNTPLFPTTNSHSILMDEDNAKNQFTFRYIQDDKVIYRVRYLEKSTNIELEDMVEKTSTHAIVTEKFIPIEDYIPESYYIRKVLAYDGSGDEFNELNEIIFYYTRDEDHAPFVIEYYTPVLGATDEQLYEGGKPKLTIMKNGEQIPNPWWHLEQSEIGTADLNQSMEREIDKDKFSGFDYSQASVTQYGDTTTTTYYDSTAEKVSGKVTKNGLEIRIFYTRTAYPYTVKFVEYGTGQVLGYGRLDADGNIITNTDGTQVFPSDGGNKAPFESTICYTAPAAISKTQDGEKMTFNFYMDDPDSGVPTAENRTKELTIRASSQNVMTFYYQLKTVTIHYEAVCSAPGAKGYGVVDLNSEQVASAKNLSGSNAIPGDGFLFKGWFMDPECTKPVKGDWRYDPGATNKVEDDVQRPDGTKLKPGNLLDPETSEEVDQVTYYALFEPVKENILIRKEGENLGTDTFLFRLNGTDVLGNQVNMVVSIQGKGSVTIKDLYCGTYTVTELTDWSWAYTCDNGAQTVTLTTADKDGSGKLLNPQITTYEVTFRNSPKAVDWLHGESAAAENQFTIVSAP